MINRVKLALISRDRIKIMIAENPFIPELREQLFVASSGWGELTSQATKPDGEPIAIEPFEFSVRIIPGSNVEKIQRDTGLPVIDVSKLYILTRHTELLKDGLFFDYNGNSYKTTKTRTHKMFNKEIYKFAELDDITKEALNG